MNTDDKIRAILQMEADAVEPSPAGYDAIRNGIAERRRRTWWVWGGSAFAGVALTTAAAVVAFSGTPVPRTIDAPPQGSVSATATTEPTTGPTTAPTTAPTVAPQPPGRPLGAIWPLTTQHELNEWNADRSSYPALATVSGSALGFARQYLLVSDAKVASSDTKDGVFVFDVMRGEQVVARLELKGYGEGNTAPFLVNRVTSAAVGISSPLPEKLAGSPLRVEGDVREVEPAITVRLRADGPGSAPIELGDVRATNNAPNVWHAELAFATTQTTGSIMVTIGHPRGDGISAAAVIPVTFTAATGTPAGDGFAGIKDQRVALFAPDGTFKRFLADELPGGGPSAPDVSPDGRFVAWSQGAGTCASTVQYVPVAGGTPVTVESNGVAALPTWVGDGRIAYAHTVCGSGGDTTTLKLYDLATKTKRTLRTLADVPVALAAGSDGRHLAYVLRDTLTTYELATGAVGTVDPNGCRWRGVDVIGTSTLGKPILLTAQSCGGATAVRVERFATNAPDRDMVAEVKNDAVAYRVSIDSASGAVLVSHGLEDGEPYVERFDRDGDVTTVYGVEQAAW